MVTSTKHTQASELRCKAICAISPLYESVPSKGRGESTEGDDEGELDSKKLLLLKCGDATKPGEAMVEVVDDPSAFQGFVTGATAPSSGGSGVAV